MKIVSEKEDELNPPLTKEQQVEKEKHDALLDELNALIQGLILRKLKRRMLKKFFRTRKLNFLLGYLKELKLKLSTNQNFTG